MSEFHLPSSDELMRAFEERMAKRREAEEAAEKEQALRLAEAYMRRTGREAGRA